MVAGSQAGSLRMEAAQPSLRQLWLLAAVTPFTFSSVWLPSEENALADAFSRYNWPRASAFDRLAPQIYFSGSTPITRTCFYFPHFVWVLRPRRFPIARPPSLRLCCRTAPCWHRRVNEAWVRVGSPQLPRLLCPPASTGLPYHLPSPFNWVAHLAISSCTRIGSVRHS